MKSFKFDFGQKEPLAPFKTWILIRPLFLSIIILLPSMKLGWWFSNSFREGGASFSRSIPFGRRTCGLPADTFSDSGARDKGRLFLSLEG